ncbi:chromate transporter, partial [Lactonifactor longoviformis]
FLSFLQIGAFSIGGGYAALPLIQSQVVHIQHWLTAGEFTDLVTISQMTPGPIAINAATFVGLRLGGVLGAVIATLGCILPSCIIMSILAYFYFKYRELEVLQTILQALRPAVVALIASAGLGILVQALWSDSSKGISLETLSLSGGAIFVVSIILLRKRKMNPIKVMGIAGALNVVLFYASVLLK